MVKKTLKWNKKTPYIVGQKIVMDCHHGPDRKKCHKEKRACKVDTQSVCGKKKKQKQLRDYLKNNHALKKNYFIHVKLPDPKEHNNHTLGQAESNTLPIDERIVMKIRDLVNSNVIRVGEVQRHIQLFVKDVICQGKTVQSMCRRLFPSRRDIALQIRAARQKQIKSKCDQENLQVKLEQWKSLFPNDNFYFRPLPDQENDQSLLLSESTELNSFKKKGFLFVHQTAEQSQLLKLYGNDITMLDATYRTSKYAMPLFQLCVKTNCDYQVVAVFVTQYEDSATILEPLQLLQQWNPEWQPQHVMVDFAESEINALRHVFPDCKVFICDFHREQAWLRWLSSRKHGVASFKQEILQHLRGIASANTAAEMDSLIEVFKSSDLWKDHEMLSNWFSKKWLPHCEVLTASLSVICEQANTRAGRELYTSIEFFPLEVLLTGKGPSLAKDLDIFKYEMIFAPFNSGEHWELTVLFPGSFEIAYLNPLGELDSRRKAVISAWRRHLTERKNAGKKLQWREKLFSHSKQQDSHSCGVFVIKFVENLVTSEGLHFKTTKDAVVGYRKDIAIRLLSESAHVSDICRACCNYNSQSISDWVQCDTCHWWYHYQCSSTTMSLENLKLTPTEYVCQLCQSVSVAVSDSITAPSFELVQRTRRHKVCRICGPLKDDIAPPNDFLLKRQEKYSFFNKCKQSREEKWGNRFYHVACVFKKVPGVTESDFIVSPEINSKLSQAHIAYLNSCGMPIK